MVSVRYLGHAGFIVEGAGVRLLMDPWFYPAFLGSWFPYPDNRALLPDVIGPSFDYLYVSHTHEDHFDERVLDQLDRSVTVLVPKYRSKELTRRFAALGFTNQVLLGHKESAELAPGMTVTMYLDTSHKEDSGLLVDVDGFRFLDLNDCNTPMTELPTDVDLLAAQHSGAMWYPNCYAYPPDVMQKKVDAVRADLMDTLARKVRLTGARAYLPSAGPACFLDPVLERFNDRETTIFPHWEDVAGRFAVDCPEVAVVRAHPGHTLRVDEHRSIRLTGEPTSVHEDLAAYRDRRRDEWLPYHQLPDAPVTAPELEAYFGTLQRWNKRFLHDFGKELQLVASEDIWQVRLGRLAEHYVIEAEEPFDPEYTLLVEPRLLRAIIDRKVGWEEALLSMRIALHREPDVFDLTFMSLLRYGHQPAQTMQMVRERERTETIERDGLRMQRFCPHAGEDLALATISDNVIECPRHHWKWDARTGRCIDGGDIDLRLVHLDETGS